MPVPTWTPSMKKFTTWLPPAPGTPPPVEDVNVARNVTVWPKRAGLAVEVNASRLAALVTVCVTELDGAPGAKSVSPL